DRGRKQQHHHDVLHGALCEEVLEYEGPHMTEAEETEEPSKRPLQTQVNAALKRLSQRDQKLLELVYSGMNASKVAEEMGDTPQNIRQRHHRLLKKLTAELNSHPAH
ncbi:MAG: hypothetical protein NTV80_06815, partial [Verrucomicrobia bacterium]|nr:hypothetical protein [Verrucomicrobiota bacterium]